MPENLALAGNLLLLSPHPDDIAYSCGGLVASGLGAAEATLLTVFGRSEWTVSPLLASAGAEVVSKVRIEEDRRYCAARGIVHTHLDFPDASLRGYDDEGELLAATRDDPLTDEVVDAVTAAVRSASPDLVLAPAAMGDHIDHLIVHEAARRLDAEYRTLYYEDIPYSAHHDLRAVDDTLANARNLALDRVVDISPVLDDKIAGMRVYESQTDAQAIADMRFHAGRVARTAGGCAERLWAPRTSP
ncbi:N-acetylglucosaminyl deacetylase, LmbE family [Streptoalloteichus tenebrarius]|uniref:N-acetylglucosaminyl deacetylase, LmbE family n=1 Tax=Streptoalloteichus tenebrarius (strain ATCC 17920 / DSM 40477 / JCM 4838 / CBS 697.72 / NBRC 16177 / NCIMB 11028 / NRRL B-12390 / A12253. 1 / ISP 5477) TaxID=1933 RepID=Q2MFL2_STRSD|nr:PIG-L family deacetylase [Streptoalloteichus tenebrarius]MCP2262622.1 N-acetylglucosaminyl deacetylase, LmbE family [Streptoalloteichus tenebrarius]BFF00867.1 PIG-L family deacetylase [Streptoalloteichus tenebrarius]CAF33029.1 putative aminoglycoside N-acetylhexosaminyl deacetylase or alpha-ketoglutaramate amidase [Streptoalloteichus tenebrarius]